MTDAHKLTLKVAVTLAHRGDAANAIAEKAIPGIDRLYWSKLAQDYGEMAGTLRAAVLIDKPELVEVRA